jgi:hypothetical protein
MERARRGDAGRGSTVTDDYETRTFTVDLSPHLPSSWRIREVLQPLGDEAWEITYVGSGFDRSDRSGVGMFSPYETGGGRWVEARRPPYGSLGPSSWEYTGYNIHGAGSNWSAHLASRGWERVPGKWYSYMGEQWYVFKRTDVWRGTDDGDIHAQLARLGFAVNRGGPLTLPGSTDGQWVKPLWQVIEEILDTKWQLSAEAGQDVGTARAVEHWRSMQ